MHRLVKPLLGLFLLSANAHGQGTVLWDESVNGSFSHDSSMPTSLMPLQAGTNSVIGATEIVPTGNNFALYPDFFTFQIPTNYFVSAIYLHIDKPSVWTWVGEPNFINQIGFSFSPTNGELLNQLGLSSIPASTYGMYLANNDLQSFTSIANYRLDFFVQTVPEPGAVSLLLVGAGVVGFLRWKKLR